MNHHGNEIRFSTRPVPGHPDSLSNNNQSSKGSLQPDLFLTSSRLSPNEVLFSDMSSPNRPPKGSPFFMDYKSDDDSFSMDSPQQDTFEAINRPFQSFQRRHSRRTSQPMMESLSEPKKLTPLAKHARALSAAMGLNEGSGTRSGVIGLREQEKRTDELSKENFSLKLKVYHLEEKLANVSSDRMDEILQENMAYKIQVKESINEVKRYRAQLLEARQFIETFKKEKPEGDAPLPPCMSPEQEKEFNEKLKEAEECKRGYRELTKVFEKQDLEIKELQGLLSEYKEKKDAVTQLPSEREPSNMDRRRNSTLGFHGHDTNRERAHYTKEAHDLEWDQRNTYNSLVHTRQRLEEAEIEIVHLRQHLEALEYDNDELESSQKIMLSDLEFYQEEVRNLKYQLHEPPSIVRSSSLKSSSASEHLQSILLETLREQLDNAKSQLKQPCHFCGNAIDPVY